MRRSFIFISMLLVSFNVASIEPDTLKEEILEGVRDEEKTEEDAMDELIDACIEGDYDNANAIFREFKGIIPRTINLVKKPRIQFANKQERARVLKTLKNFQMIQKTFHDQAVEDQDSKLSTKECLWKYKGRFASAVGIGAVGALAILCAYFEFGKEEALKEFADAILSDGNVQKIANAVWANKPAEE